eukprot:3652815-Rhodomonas_salina.1
MLLPGFGGGERVVYGAEGGWQGGGDEVTSPHLIRCVLCHVPLSDMPRAVSSYAVSGTDLRYSATHLMRGVRY